MVVKRLHRGEDRGKPAVDRQVGGLPVRGGAITIFWTSSLTTLQCSFTASCSDLPERCARFSRFVVVWLKLASTSIRRRLTLVHSLSSTILSSGVSPTTRSLRSLSRASLFSVPGFLSNRRWL